MCEPLESYFISFVYYRMINNRNLQFPHSMCLLYVWVSYRIKLKGYNVDVDVDVDVIGIEL